MTKTEAIKMLRGMKADNLNLSDLYTRDKYEALVMAIKALEQQPCEDAISRYAVKDWFCTNYCSEHNKCEHFEKGDCNSMNELYSLPFVTPQPKTGHWIKVGDRGFGWSDTVICKCSECEYQKEFTGKFDGQNLIVDMEHADNYCPNCGAKME